MTRSMHHSASMPTVNAHSTPPTTPALSAQLLTPPGTSGGRPHARRPKKQNSLLEFNRLFSFSGSFVEADIVYAKAPPAEVLEPEPETPTSSVDGAETTHATLSGLQAGITLFKALVGPGLLFLPAGFKNAGLVSGLLISALVGAIATYCMVLLVDTNQMLSEQGLVVMSLGDIGEHTCGVWGRRAVNCTVFAAQIGFCIAYCVFVSENLQAVIYECNGGMVVTDTPEHPCDLSGVWGEQSLVYYIILTVIPLLIPFTWVRQIR